MAANHLVVLLSYGKGKDKVQRPNALLEAGIKPLEVGVSTIILKPFSK
jgi:hypothetical protein